MATASQPDAAAADAAKECAAAAPAPLERPLPGAWSVREGRDSYLRENGFSIEAYDEPTTQATLLGIRFRVPNTPKHRWAIMLHDLHHVATGFGTDFAGEAEISAWEAHQGLRPLGLYTGWIVGSLALMGFLVAPRRVREAWRASRAPNLFHRPDRSYEEILGLSVAELRGMLGLPEEGISTRTRRLHANAPVR